MWWSEGILVMTAGAEFEAYGGICEGDQREGRYSSHSGGDKAVEEDRTGAFTKGRMEITRLQVTQTRNRLPMKAQTTDIHKYSVFNS